jgi:hypothetical protein
MKKLFFVLAALMMVPALYAAEDTPIQNVCDSLSLHGHPEINLVPAYIEESNWYGNPQTWVKDSSNVVRHESYETVKVKIKSFSEYALPISVHAACREMEGTTYKYATWNNSKEWVEREDDDYATFIHDVKEFTTEGHDKTNTYNILTFVHGSFPGDNEPYQSHQLLFSTTFEFAFEWWYVGLSYEFVYDTIIDGKTYAATRSNYFNAVGNDSLETFNSAKKKFNYPEGLKTVRVQSLKVVLVDSRKVPEPESSSSVVVSSSSEVKSSSSHTPATSSSAEQSSSSGTPGPTSSADDESSSSTGPASSSSSNVPESSSTQESSSSDKPATSSSGIPATSSSGTQGTSSSGAEPESSSSEKSARLVTAPTLDGSARMVQVRTLDGSIVNNSGKLAPGVYYVKYSNGKWSKMAVLPR